MPQLSLIDYLFGDNGPSDRERQQRMKQSAMLRGGWGEQPGQTLAPNVFQGQGDNRYANPQSDRTIMGDLAQLIPPNPPGGPTQAEQDRARRLEQEAGMRAVSPTPNMPNFAPDQSVVSSAPGFQNPAAPSGQGLQLGQQPNLSAIPPAITQAAMAQPQPPVTQMPQQPAAPVAPRGLVQARAAAGGGGGGPGATSVAPTGLSGEEAALRQRTEELNRQYEAAMKPPDQTAMKEAYAQRQQGGMRGLILALAAKNAGQGFEPFQGQFLKRAAAAEEPMKMAGGTMTPEGFIEDPGYKQDLELKRIQAQLAQSEHKLENNLSRQDRKEELARHEAMQVRLANITASTARAAQSNKTPTQIGTDPTTKLPVFAVGDKLMQFKDGQWGTYGGNLGGKAGEGGGKETEGERKAAGYLGRMEAAESTLGKIGETGRAGLITKTLGHTGLGGTVRPFVESNKQQQYRQAQEDWVRAKLRPESGAVIGADEMDREIAVYFPQPGDQADVIAQKRQAREQALQELRTMAGPVSSTIAPTVGGGGGGLPTGWSVITR